MSNLATTAKDMGDHFLVDGNKKWITNGIYADYFTVAVRTGPPGERAQGPIHAPPREDHPGITVSKMDCMGVWPSGTTYIEFDNVRVPKTNVVGKVGEGFKQVMYNFNHERWLLAGQAARMARTCVEESMRLPGLGARSASSSSSIRLSSTRSGKWRDSARLCRLGSRTSPSR